jgi:beta-barrel assembly-enhancing protease
MRHSATTVAATLMLLLCFTQAVSACPEDDLRTDQSQRPEQQPKVKEGGKDDIDAIGNRDIGGRGLGNWYSLETEIRLGREYAQMIDSTGKSSRL